MEVGEADTASCGSLYAITGPYTERTFAVHDRGGLIGRSRKCPVSLLHDCEVSHNHAIVEPHAHASNGFCIRDIGSTFGTYLNDKRLSEPKRASEPYKLKPGDTVKVGQTTLRWQPREHLEAAASVLRIPPPPVGLHGARATPVDAELQQIGGSLAASHRLLCSTAAPVELAPVARRLEQLLRVQARLQEDVAPVVSMAAERDEWRALLKAECDSLRRDVTALAQSQREALRKLLGAQSGVWSELRLATSELASGAGAPTLPAAVLQWIRDANHHARWGYRVIRLTQLWLTALEGLMHASAVAEAPLEPHAQRQRMLDGDARTLHSALLTTLRGNPVDAREAVDARERLAVCERELILLHRAHPALAKSPTATRAALSVDATCLPELCTAEHIVPFLPWTLRCYRLRQPPSPTAWLVAGCNQGCLGCEAFLEESPCILQPCRLPPRELDALQAKLARLVVRQAESAPGTQYLPAVRAVWREPDGVLWAHLAKVDEAPTATVDDGRAGRAPGGMDAQAVQLRPNSAAVLSHLATNWRRGFVDLAAALSTLHRHDLCAAGISADDITLDAAGHAVLLSLGLARLGSMERPAPAGSWRWAAIPPEAVDAGRGEMDEDETADLACSPEDGMACAPATWSADMWGVGVLLWRVHFGEDLGPIEAWLCKPRAQRTAHVPPPERADPQLRAILAHLLRADPLRRMTASELLSHPLLLPPPATCRAASLPDSAAALFSPDDDAATVAAAVGHARSALADVRAHARGDANRPAAVVTVRDASFCADMLAAVSGLADAELLGTLVVRLQRDGAMEGRAMPIAPEAALDRFWDELFRDKASELHVALFDCHVSLPLGVHPGPTPSAGATGGTANAGDGAAAGAGPTGVELSTPLLPNAPMPRADADESLLEALGRLIFKCLLDALPLPLTSLPSCWWRAIVGLGATCGLPELEPVAPLLALQWHALIASGNTDGWMLDFEQLGQEAGDVPQARKLQWVAAKVRFDLWATRERALNALHRGFARASCEASANAQLQLLPAEALMLAATGGLPPIARQLREAMDFRDFPEGSLMPAHLCQLIDMMSSTQLRRFILLLTGLVDLPASRSNGTGTVITVKYWPNATDCAPIAHRAALTLDLPWYNSYDKLRQMFCRTLDDMPEAQPMNSYDPDDFSGLALKGLPWT